MPSAFFGREEKRDAWSPDGENKVAGMEKTKLLELIDKKIHTEYMIVEEVDDDALTVEPFIGIVHDGIKDGLLEITGDIHEG
ncbi:MAG: hypothetical protein LBR80_03555 [Deltaproteobacteria bacterium]|nr:hypothetical protein [Deltaproteobacteria bacterium]